MQKGPVTYVSPRGLDLRSSWDAECYVCGTRGKGNPCESCRKLAVQARAALAGSRAAQAALVALGADPDTLRAELASHRRTLLTRVAELVGKL